MVSNEPPMWSVTKKKQRSLNNRVNPSVHLSDTQRRAPVLVSAKGSAEDGFTSNRGSLRVRLLTKERYGKGQGHNDWVTSGGPPYDKLNRQAVRYYVPYPTMAIQDPSPRQRTQYVLQPDRRSLPLRQGFQNPRKEEESYFLRESKRLWSRILSLSPLVIKVLVSTEESCHNKETSS